MKTVLKIFLFFNIIISSVYIYCYRYEFKILILSPDLFAQADKVFPGLFWPNLSSLQEIDLSLNATYKNTSGVGRFAERLRLAIPMNKAKIVYDNTTFERFIAQLGQADLYCTDFTYLHILAAHYNGYAARNWTLWNDRNFKNAAHSVAEIRLPGNKLIVVDGQNNDLLTYKSEPLSMMDALGTQALNLLFKPFDKNKASHGVLLNTRHIYFPEGIFLNLQFPDWLGLKQPFLVGVLISKTFFPIGNIHIWLTKVVFINIIILGFVCILFPWGMRRRSS